MLPFMNKKKAVSTILGGMAGEKEEKVEMEADEAPMAIAKDVLRAVESGSAAALMEAMKAFYAHMEAQEHEEMGEEI